MGEKKGLDSVEFLFPFRCHEGLMSHNTRGQEGIKLRSKELPSSIQNTGLLTPRAAYLPFFPMCGLLGLHRRIAYHPQLCEVDYAESE